MSVASKKRNLLIQKGLIFVAVAAIASGGVYMMGKSGLGKAAAPANVQAH